ncbi:MAG: hypothetical protein J7K65_04105, partial [Planctomycetes bacterium]|nr:hypothetical protein [Planctomycetota bacterium]
INGFILCPILKFLDQQQTRYRIEFFRRPAHGGVEMSANSVNRHQLKDDVAKSTVLAVEQACAGFFGQNAVKRVEKLCLLRIYKVTHNRSK